MTRLADMTEGERQVSLGEPSFESQASYDARIGREWDAVRRRLARLRSSVGEMVLDREDDAFGRRALGEYLERASRAEAKQTEVLDIWWPGFRRIGSPQ